MTISMGNFDLKSTSGRAPPFRATMRRWMSADNLNRPPTLLTISSSFRGSIMRSPHGDRGRGDVNAALVPLPEFGQSGVEPVFAELVAVDIVKQGQRTDADLSRRAQRHLLDFEIGRQMGAARIDRRCGAAA